MPLYAVCPLNHWGELDTPVDLRTHTLWCPCGQEMDPKLKNPLLHGWQEDYKVPVSVTED